MSLYSREKRRAAVPNAPIAYKITVSGDEIRKNHQGKAASMIFHKFMHLP
jgi:hypothetical protein